MLSRLERVASFVRGEVAAAITRKRTPALVFRVLLREAARRPRVSGRRRARPARAAAILAACPLGAGAAWAGPSPP